jgi:outer membrane protein TolC
MNDPALPIRGDATIVPTSEPIDAPLLVDFDEGVDVALVYRPEIGQQQLAVRNAYTVLKVGRNNLLPRLDVVVTGGFQGLGESFADSVENQFGFDNLTAGFGIQLEVPMGNREARGILRRARLQREQALLQYAGLVRQIELDVKQAQINLNANFEVLRAQRVAREQAQATVDTFDRREAAGEEFLTPEYSDRRLRVIDTLGDARSAEAQALADYNIALARYQQAKGTLLRFNNVTLEEAPDLLDRLPYGLQ